MKPTGMALRREETATGGCRRVGAEAAGGDSAAQGVKVGMYGVRPTNNAGLDLCH
jgi:hypothetical protein